MKSNWFRFGLPAGCGLALAYFLLIFEVLFPIASLIGTAVALLLFYGVTNTDEVEALLKQCQDLQRSLSAANEWLSGEAQESVERLLACLANTEKCCLNGQIDRIGVQQLSIELKNVAFLPIAADKYVHCKKDGALSDEEAKFVRVFPEKARDVSERLAQAIRAVLEGKEADLQLIEASFDSFDMLE